MLFSLQDKIIQTNFERNENGEGLRILTLMEESIEEILSLQHLLVENSEAEEVNSELGLKKGQQPVIKYAMAVNIPKKMQGKFKEEIVLEQSHLENKEL